MITHHGPRPTGPALHERKEELLRHHTRHLARLALPEPIARQFSNDPVLSLETGRDRQPRLWLATPAERDPLRTRAERHFIPRDQRSELTRISRLGIGFQRIVIAHEIAVTPDMAHLVEQLTDGPRRCTDEMALALAGSPPPHPALVTVTRVLDGIVGWGASVASTVVQRAGEGLDPIVFGILGHPEPVRHGDLALWYPLAAWVW